MVSYNGAHFCGWQMQPNIRSVEAVLRCALSKLPGDISHIQAAGRTDAGVHATGQVVAFNIANKSIPAEKFPHILNKWLPLDLQVIHSEEVAIQFNPRRDAIARLYCYRIRTQQALYPTIHNITIIRHQLNLTELNQLAQLFIGTHDFSAFASSKDMHLSKIRTIHSAYFVMQDGTLHFYIKGNAFLMNMVRRIVGTLIQPHQSFSEKYERITRALKYQHKEFTGATAIPNGLTLECVYYEKPMTPVKN
ncbi:tRNA pseudouridine(38-40) synthase TruA [Entomospira nematocerorum]|uniref:tRNA pseudouridine(38-40) synthase TruA n=1 Tax=Entomospira nematocerorum TaxID=2719987 RepID=UPI0024808D17|nr:tRNA pseudouridine(38-40) synthase TruA [Entomospira nematocera]WDI34522.1 tRNA pseudouridine(38-40) synthase TruA [Entomospira nematocera]